MKQFNYSKGTPNIGYGISEKDLDFIDQEFVTIPATRYLEDRNIIFIKGKKGSGKTALRIKYEATQAEEAFLLSIKPNEDDKGFLNYKASVEKVRKKFKNKVDKENINYYAWKYFYVVNLMGDIVRKKAKLNKHLVDSQIGIIDEYLRSVSLFQHQNEKAIAITSVVALTLKKLAKLKLPTSSENYDDILESTVFGSGFDAAEVALKEVLDSLDRPYMILVDGLDETLESSNRVGQNELRIFFRSFIDKTFELSAAPFHTNLDIKAFVPKDFFEHSIHRQKDKIDLLTREIRFQSQKKEQVVFERLKKHYGDRDTDTKEMLNYYFPEDLIFKPRTGFRGKTIDFPVNVFLDAYTITPRDHIKLYSKVFSLTSEEGKEVIDKDVVMDAVAEYSNEKLNSLEAELIYNFPDISLVFNALSNGCRKYKVLELKEYLSDRNAINDFLSLKLYIQTLFEYGFFSVVEYETIEVDGEVTTNELDEILYEDKPSMPITDDSTVAICKAFCPALYIIKYSSYEYW